MYTRLLDTYTLFSLFVYLLTVLSTILDMHTVTFVYLAHYLAHRYI